MPPDPRLPTAMHLPALSPVSPDPCAGARRKGEERRKGKGKKRGGEREKGEGVSIVSSESHDRLEIHHWACKRVSNLKNK